MFHNVFCFVCGSESVEPPPENLGIRIQMQMSKLVQAILHCSPTDIRGQIRCMWCECGFADCRCSLFSKLWTRTTEMLRTLSATFVQPSVGFAIVLQSQALNRRIWQEKDTKRTRTNHACQQHTSQENSKLSEEFWQCLELHGENLYAASLQEEPGIDTQTRTLLPESCFSRVHCVQTGIQICTGSTQLDRSKITLIWCEE